MYYVAYNISSRPVSNVSQTIMSLKLIIEHWPSRAWEGAPTKHWLSHGCGTLTPLSPCKDGCKRVVAVYCCVLIIIAQHNQLPHTVCEVVLRGRLWAVLDMNGWMLSDSSRDHLGFLTVQM